MRTRLLQAGVVGISILVAACGGSGGGVTSTPTPASSPTPQPTSTASSTPDPTPTATPTATPTNYDTTEYRATVGAVSMNALAAYQTGATGAGIKVGVIDSGIDLQSAEFGSRIDPASTSTAGNGTVDDEGGHGTAVAFTIAGRRDGVGSQGVAFDATLVVARTDTPGSCAGDGCSHSDAAIATGIDLARTTGARVINISLGGSAPASSVVAAVGRATAAGIVVVISAGNDATANPNPFAGTLANATATARGLVIIAGSVAANGTISSFSDRAGDGAAHYLAAVGESVRAPDENGVSYLWSGTSFSAPQITGAIALLAQAFPNLTGAQIVSLLYASARDAGAAGVDAIYGNGILDLTRAFQPIGAITAAGTKTTVSLGENAVLSAPMGDAGQGQLGAVILDGYARAFAVDLAGTIRRTSPSRTLTDSLVSGQRNFTRTIGGSSVALTIAEGRGDVSVERTMIGREDATRARILAGTVTTRLGSSLEFGFGISETGSVVSAQLAGRGDPAFLIARDPVRTMGFNSASGGSAAVRQALGPWGLTVAAESGNVLARGTDMLPALRYRDLRSTYQRLAIGIDRRLGGLNLGLTATRMAEADTVLGARFGDGLGAPNASSWFVDGAARWNLSNGWTLGGSYRQGWTFASTRNGISGSGMLHTNAFSADIGKYGVLGGGDSVGLRVAQPLRVTHGGLTYLLPTGYDYDTLAVTDWTAQTLNLAPSGHELILEVRYGFPVRVGGVSANLFWRRDPGNYAVLAPERGMAMRYTVEF